NATLPQETVTLEAPEPAQALYEEPVPTPAPKVEALPEESVVASTPKAPSRKPTLIERLHGAQTELELHTVDALAKPAEQEAVAEEEPAAEPVQLNAESESEIEVSAEAETLVEASVGPVTYQLPDEIAITETAQIDEIASQLREGAWRSAM